MFLHLLCSFYFMIAVIAVNETYDESNQNFHSNTVYDNVNDDFQVRWTHENTRQQPGTSTSHEPEPLSLENINALFYEQYRGKTTYEHQWFDTIPNPTDDLWDNLCDQTWHNKGKKDYRNIQCEAEKKGSNSRRNIWMPNGFMLKADHKKCSCPRTRKGGQYKPVTDSNHNFLVVQHNENNYFTLIYINSSTAIIHGYVQNIQPPFTETFNTTRKYYYTAEARKYYEMRN